MHLKKKIFIAGAKGMVGSAVCRNLYAKNYSNLLESTSIRLDLTKQKEVEDFFVSEKPETVLICAAKVGGILANNTFRAEFIYENLLIEANLIHTSFLNKVEKLIFLGSSCIYPKFSEQPIREESLLTGTLEPTNEPYSIAKIAGIKLCENYYRQYGCNFYSVMPTNLYGMKDNFNLESSHVIPALIRKFHEAKISKSEKVVLWGTGEPRREFLYVDDLAEAIVFLMEEIDAKKIYDKGITHINIGTGEDIEIIEVARMIKEIIGFQGEIENDLTKPDGTPRKLLDVSRLTEFGWKYRTNLEEGLRKTYSWYLENFANSEEK